MYRIGISCAVIALATIMPVQLARAQGRGEGAVVIRDGVTIYKSSTGPKEELKEVPRGFAVAGVTTAGVLGETYQFEQEGGRLHVQYLKLDKDGEQKSTPRNGWMDPADLERFAYECGCGAGSEGERVCSPLAISGFGTRSWNVCFKDALSKKMAELKARSESPSADTTSVALDSSKSSATSPSEKPITNEDVVALAKADLGDDIVVAKIQQAPSRAPPP